MTVPVPSIEWPTEFAKKGPPEDATILLIAEAEIAGIAFNIVALRMRAGRRMPDYLDGVAESAYDVAMGGMMDDIENLADSLEHKLILLNDTSYLLWMAPAAYK